MPVTPPVIGSDIRQWGRELNLFLRRNLGKLFFKQSDDIPADNGIFCGMKQGISVVRQWCVSSDSYKTGNALLKHWSSRQYNRNDSLGY